MQHFWKKLRDKSRSTGHFLDSLDCSLDFTYPLPKGTLCAIFERIVRRNSQKTVVTLTTSHMHSIHNKIYSTSLPTNTIMKQVPVLQTGSDRQFNSSIVRQLYSPTAQQSDSLIGNIYVMCMGFLNFIFFLFQIHGLIHTLQSDSNNVSIYLIFFFSQFYAKVLDYRVV